MSRKTFRIILVALLVISGGFATWSWTRPYEWGADDAARCRVLGCLVQQDHSNYWVTLQLKVDKDANHDLEQPVRLLTAAGDEIEPAETILEGTEGQPISKIWFKFWLEKGQLNGPLSLKINQGELSVRSGSGLPKLRSDGSRYYVTRSW